MKKEDCTFTAPFEVVCTANDYIHALVVYFDISFGASHKPCGFSTHPKAKSTHWKQTVMYLDHPITCCEGERLSGTITTACVPSPHTHACLSPSACVHSHGHPTLWCCNLTRIHDLNPSAMCFRPNAKNPRDLDIKVVYTFEGKHTTVTAHEQEFRMR